MFVPYSRRLRDLAREQPDHLALVLVTADACERFTYAELDSRVDVFATGLRSGGVDDGTTVVIVGPNSTATLFASAAAWRLGAFVVPLSPKSTQRDLQEILQVADQPGRHIVVVSDNVIPADHIPHLQLCDLQQSVCDQTIDDKDPYPARAIPSGGTTGRAKLIIDQEPWGKNDDAGVLSTVGWDEAERILIYSPLYHNVGQTLTHRALMDAKTAVLMDKFDATRVRDVLLSEEIDFFFAVPVHMRRLLDLPNIGRADFATIKSMYHSGAHCAPTLKKQWLKLVGADRVWEAYGATDGTGFTLIGGNEWEVHEGSVGKPYRSKLRILDDDMDEIPIGQVGLIYMKPDGPSQDRIGPVYFGSPPPKTTDDGFRTVGDMGYVDEEGYLYVVDRRTDLIISGGANVFPAEVETALCQHAAIREVAVVGLPDERWGSRVHAVIVPLDRENPPTVEDLDNFMKSQIVGYKRPKSYGFESSLPYTDVGKVDRHRLVGLYKNGSRDWSHVKNHD